MKNQGQVLDATDRETIWNETRLFVALTVLLTAIVFIWMFSSSSKNPLSIAIMMWVPGISALMTCALKKIRVSELGWRSGKLMYWAESLILPILVALLGYGITWLTGLTEFTSNEVANYRWARMLGFETPAPLWAGILSKGLLASLLALPFVLGEEIGWSGFLVPRLRKLLSVPVASIAVGLFWSIWHYPAIIGGLYGTGAPLWIALPGFTLVLTGTSFFRTILVDRARSLWPGVILHVSHNVFLMGIFWEMTAKGTYSSWLVSESGLFLGAVSVICGLLLWHMSKDKESPSLSQG